MNQSLGPEASLPDGLANWWHHAWADEFLFRTNGLGGDPADVRAYLDFAEACRPLSYSETLPDQATVEDLAFTLYDRPTGQGLLAEVSAADEADASLAPVPFPGAGPVDHFNDWGHRLNCPAFLAWAGTFLPCRSEDARCLFERAGFSARVRVNFRPSETVVDAPDPSHSPPIGLHFRTTYSVRWEPIARRFVGQVQAVIDRASDRLGVRAEHLGASVPSAATRLATNWLRDNGVAAPPRAPRIVTANPVGELADRLEFINNQRALMDMLAKEFDGEKASVPLPDVFLKFEWGTGPDGKRDYGPWRSMCSAMDKKLRSEGWQLRRLNNHAHLSRR